MAVRRGVRLIALVSLLFALMAVAFGTQTAGAVSVDTVTGGQSKLFVPLKVVQQLNKDRIISAPNGGAYITFVSTEGPAVVFPISDGTVESITMLGTVNHPGGLTIQKVDQNFQVTKELVATNFKIVNGNTLVGNVLGLVPAPQGDLINATHSKDPSTGVISYQADVQLNLVTTTILNTYFDTTVFTPGMILGHLVSTIQTKKVIGL
jgi:hypothetical protein